MSYTRVPMRIPSCIALALLAPAIACAQDEAIRLDDLGTRLQFAFYTADVNALERDQATLLALTVPAPLAAVKATFAGFGAWKRSELLRATDPAKAADAARQCVVELDRAVALEPKRAALHAMLSACQGLVAGLQGRVKVPLAAGRAKQSLERALQLSPREPHVLLIDGQAELDRARAGAGDLAAARKKLVAATAAFEDMGQSLASDAFTVALGWGAAEAWNALGQLEGLAGNQAAARDAFERALVLVGDYRDVQQRLKQMTGKAGPAP
ncbi:MAG: hypothetical protein ABL964_11195 [Steroidobacteraceae bacterium]